MIWHLEKGSLERTRMSGTQTSDVPDMFGHLSQWFNCTHWHVDFYVERCTQILGFKNEHNPEQERSNVHFLKGCMVESTRNLLAEMLFISKHPIAPIY